MKSIYSAGNDLHCGSVTIQGRIEIGLQYNYKQGALEILVTQCEDLAVADIKRNRSDPYVKVIVTIHSF